MIRRTILDTDILSEIMRDKNETVRARARAYLNEHARFTISAITIVEIVKGLHKAKRQDALERFITGLDAMEIIVLDRPRPRSPQAVSTAIWSGSVSRSGARTS